MTDTRRPIQHGLDVLGNRRFTEIAGPVMRENYCTEGDAFLLYTFRHLFDENVIEYFATEYKGTVDEKLREVGIPPGFDGYEDAVRIMTDARYRGALISFWKRELGPALLKETVKH